MATTPMTRALLALGADIDMELTDREVLLLVTRFMPEFLGFPLLTQAEVGRLPPWNDVSASRVSQAEARLVARLQREVTNILSGGTPAAGSRARHEA